MKIESRKLKLVRIYSGNNGKTGNTQLVPLSSVICIICCLFRITILLLIIVVVGVDGKVKVEKRPDSCLGTSLVYCEL